MFLTFHYNLTVWFTFNCLIQSDVEVTVKKHYNYSTVLGTAIKCTVRLQWKLGQFKNCKNYIEYIYSVICLTVSLYCNVFRKDMHVIIYMA